MLREDSEAVKISDFRIERFYAEFEFSTPYMISGSDAESMTIDELLSLDGKKEENLAAMLDLKLSYTEAKGDPELRELISELYEGLGADDVITYSGAEEGIFGFMAGFLQEGDELIVQFPCYQSLHEIARANGVKVTYWEMREDQGWRSDFTELRRLVGPRTRAVLVNTPQNPTGINLTHEEQAELISVCREFNLYLFSDEVYRMGEHDVRNRLRPAASLYDRAISLGVLSKPLGLPGLRVGWIATGNPELMNALEVFKDYTTICGSAPSEFLAKLALRNWESIIQRNMELILDNYAYLKEFMERYSSLFAWVEPDAGNIAFVRPLFTDEVEKFCLDLISKKGVVLLPSTKYLYADTHFRIGFGRRDFKQGLDVLESYLSESGLSGE